MRRVQVYMLLSYLMLLSVGCTGESAGDSDPAADSKEVAPLPVATTIDGQPEISIVTLRKQLGANSQAMFTKAGGKILEANLLGSGVRDITPLKGLPLKYLDLTNLPVSDLTPLAGMPLEELYLEGTQVTDLSPLKGMPLRILRMEHTPVADISPLAGMQLNQLNLYDTQVQEISAVAGMPLNILWLAQTQVREIGLLKEMSLVSLDIEQTPVSDLSPLAEMVSLQRLNIAQSAVTDLSPLKNLHLERLIFTPEKIRQGMDVVKTMSSLQKIGPTFDEVVAPAEFWASQGDQQQ